MTLTRRQALSTLGLGALAAARTSPSFAQAPAASGPYTLPALRILLRPWNHTSTR